MANRDPTVRSNGIGTLREGPLHAQLKEWYRTPGDKVEVPVDGFIIDLVRKDLLIEIQTQNFSALRKKLIHLIPIHKVLLVYPIISDKWIVYQHCSCSRISRRVSPKHCTYYSVFNELVYIPKLISRPNLSIACIIIQIEEVREKYENIKENVRGGRIRKGGQRREGWKLIQKKLITVISQRTFHNPNDFLTLLPEDIYVPFSNYDLSKKLNQSIGLTRKMTYCLRKMGVLRVVGKKGNLLLFEKVTC